MGIPFFFQDLDDVRRQVSPLIKHHLHHLELVRVGKELQPLDNGNNRTGGQFPLSIQRGMYKHSSIQPKCGHWPDKPLTNNL